MTYRERREARAERLQEWAAKRETKAQADARRASDMASVIPFGQPILVGHHSEGRDRRYRDRIDQTMHRAIESERMAESMTSRAANIESQLEQSIYDDDPDAVDRLRERVEALEAERNRIKAYNASCRKGSPDPTLLDDRQRSRYLDRSGGGPLASYVLQNLGGNIKRNRDRLAALQTRAARAERTEAAGGQLVEVLGQGIGRYARVTFAEKPAREILDELKAAGFRWAKGSWVGPADQLPASVA